MEQSRFYIFTPDANADFCAQVDDLRLQVDDLWAQEIVRPDALLQARFYLSDIANQVGLLRQNDWVNLLDGLGVVSFLEQPPLSGVKVALLLWFVSDSEKALSFERKIERLDSSEGTLVELKADDLTYYLHTYRPVDYEFEADAQTEAAFNSHIAALAKRGLNLADNCQRTWIFVRDVDRNYHDVVQARNHVFSTQNLTRDTHYIASTGIGGASENQGSLVAMDFFSMKGLSSEQIGYLHAPDYLNPTHEYGVAFERGTYLDLPTGRHFLVSGTASIDHKGRVLHTGDVLTQLGRLFLNVEKLLQSGGGNLEDMRYMIVYLRDIADYVSVNRYMRVRFPEVPFLIVEARVCRPEWLVEVEGIAVKSNAI